MQPLIEHRLTLAGYATRALELEGDGPPLLLLHGYADSADTWRFTLDRLARRGRRALALDLPGFAAADPLGNSGAPVLPQLDAFAAAAVQHLEAETGDEVVAVGNSLGGCLVLRAAQRDDLPLRAVVPVAPAGLELARWLRIIEADPLLRTLLAAPLPLPETAVRAVVGQLYKAFAFAQPRAVAAEAVAAFTSHHRTRDAIRRYLTTGRALHGELQGCFELERITVPVCLVWGDRDRMVPHRGARMLLDALPETTHELLDGVGHCPQVEAPERFSQALDRFLATLSARTPY